jgi:aryl-alcohol dehydrogenase-like predicted oxidoreductase
METRLLGRTGVRVTAIGICPGAGPSRDAVIGRAMALGCRLFASEAPVPGAVTIPGGLREGFGFVRYNLLDQQEANLAIARMIRGEGKAVIATGVLAGGALAGKASPDLASRVEALRPLVRPGRTLAQAAIQFVLANESVSAAMVRVSDPARVDEVAGALETPPLTGSDLELIFEAWANRFG